MTDDAGVRAMFSGSRLKMARLARGMTASELAKAVEVTPAAISQYENEKARPTRANIAKISLALGFPAGFFAQTGVALPDPSQAFFRSLTSTTKGIRNKAGAHAILVGELATTIDRLVELPPVNVPRHVITTPGANALPSAASAARAVREAWGLGSGPIRHLVRHMERNGIVVTRVHAETEKVDAFSRWYGVRPLIVLCLDKNDAARSRFDAAHELAHLVMHEADRIGDQAAEREAHAFAAEFLMPAAAIETELPSRPDWQHLAELKQKWGVSIQALLYRCRELGRMTDHVYRRSVTEVNRLGWRKNEPAPLTEVEQPELLAAAVDLLNENGYSLEDLASRASLPLDAVRVATVRGRPRVSVT